MAGLPDNYQKDLDERMQLGYKLVDEGDDLNASEVWLELWEKMKLVMKGNNIKFVEDLDERFYGRQSIFNWATDFELALLNAGNQDKSKLQDSIDYCTEFLAKSKNQNTYNNLGMKRVIAESNFQLGKYKEGERLYKKYTDEHPESAWGWINWSDQYWMFAKEENKNIERAVEILEQGLQVDALDDMDGLIDRLRELYKEAGMTDKLIEPKQKDLKKKKAI
jgi:tetratricopeptide (TPR) repeat protein